MQPPIQQAAHQRELMQPTGWQGRPISQSTIGSAAIASGSNAQAIGVSADRIAQVEAQVRGANIDQLTLLLSKLMASEASAAETQPVVRAARGLAVTSPASTNRSNQLAERAEQYVQLALRRDAAKAASQTTMVGLPSTQIPFANAPSIANVPPIRDGFQNAGPNTVSVSGYLVPVYSVRPDSPRLALRNRLGQTIVFVKPAPGINFRSQINTRVTVSGHQSYIPGLSTPVVIADRAVQIPQ